jgi:hypothetical protein
MATLLNDEITPLLLSLSLSNAKKRVLLSMWLTIKSGKGFANARIADFPEHMTACRFFLSTSPSSLAKDSQPRAQENALMGAEVRGR